MPSRNGFRFSHHGMGVDACLKLILPATTTLTTHLILSQSPFSSPLPNPPTVRLPNLILRLSMRPYLEEFVPAETPRAISSI